MFDREAREAASKAQRCFEQGIQAALPALGNILNGMAKLDDELSRTNRSLLRQVRDGFRKATGNFV